MTDRLQTSDLRLLATPYQLDAREYVERVYKTLVALEPLYNGMEAIEWLLTPQECLKGGIAAELLQRRGGTEFVAEALVRILDGVHS